MKVCKYCGKEITNSKNNFYCSNECYLTDKKEAKIKNWLDGTFNGTRGNDYQLSVTIRNYLIEKAGNKCEICGWNKVNPITQKVPLEIHHIDGNYLNNNEENLQVLCPNCHSLTPNFKGLNKSERQRGITRKENNICVDCGKPISSGAIRCRQCANTNRATEKPVTREELKALIRKESFVSIGKMFNVTDNAIRKWCIFYGLPSKKKDINSYSDNDWNAI